MRTLAYKFSRAALLIVTLFSAFLFSAALLRALVYHWQTLPTHSIGFP